MTTVPAPQSLPQWLVDAVMGLVASAYQAGRADRGAEVEQAAPVVEQDVLDRLEASALLRCSRTKLDGLVRDGLVPSFMIGKRRLFRRADLDAWLAGRSS